jgi:glycosyltransferase involved in cell wall biosynthesis
MLQDDRYVVILEPCHTGHRLYHVRLIADAALDLGLRCLFVTTPEARESREFVTHLDRCRTEVRLLDATAEQPVNLLSRLSRGLSIIRQTRVLLRDLGDRGVVVVPDFDQTRFAWLLAFVLAGFRPPLGPISTRGLSLRPPTHNPNVRRSIRSRVRGFLYRLGVSPRTGVAHYHLISVTELPDQADAGSPALAYSRPIVDPATLSCSTGDVLSIDAPQPFFLLAGDISARKGLTLLFDAWRLLPLNSPSLVLAGRIFTADANLVTQARDRLGERIVTIDEYLPDPVFDAYICKATGILIVRPDDDGPSGVLAKSIAAGVPVVVAGTPRLGGSVRRHGVGIWCALHPAEIADAVLTVNDRRGDFVERLAPLRVMLDEQTRAFGHRLLVS